MKDVEKAHERTGGRGNGDLDKAEMLKTETLADRKNAPQNAGIRGDWGWMPPVRSPRKGGWSANEIPDGVHPQALRCGVDIEKYQAPGFVTDGPF